MARHSMQYFIRQVEARGIYFSARGIVLLLFGSILFFPKELELALQTPILLGLMLFGTIVMSIILFGDLLTTRQKSISSLMYKYVFLTLSVILAYGLFYYLNATLFEPPGLVNHWATENWELERAVFYFSGVSYFTIGYGDVVPVGVNAQSAAITEAFLGNVINLIVLATAFQRWVWKTRK